MVSIYRVCHLRFDTDRVFEFPTENFSNVEDAFKRAVEVQNEIFEFETGNNKDQQGCKDLEFDSFDPVLVEFNEDIVLEKEYSEDEGFHYRVGEHFFRDQEMIERHITLFHIWAWNVICMTCECMAFTNIETIKNKIAKGVSRVVVCTVKVNSSESLLRGSIVYIEVDTSSENDDIEIDMDE